MRIFKIMTILLVAQLYGQSNKLIIDGIDTIFVDSFDEVNLKLDSLLRISDNIGKYFTLNSIKFDNLISYRTGEEKIILETILFNNDNEIKNKVLQQIFKPLNGTRPKKGTKKTFKSIINSIPFITDDSEILFGRDKENNVSALLNLKYNFNNYFSGLIGASRSDAQKWLITGQMDIHLENQWKNASTINLHWERFNEESQILNLYYEVPHQFGLPIGAKISYNQDLRDGSYVNTNSTIGIFKTVPQVGKLGFGWKNIKINSTDKGDSLGISNLTAKAIYADGVIDYRNDYWLPTKGLYLNLRSNIGKRVVNDSSAVIFSGELNFENYLEIYRKHILAIKVLGIDNWTKSRILHDGELTRYGGVNTLRGYSEDYFKSEWVIIPTIEYSIKLGSNQQFTIFSDFALQNKYQPLPIGYGIGFTQVTKNSILKIYYGLGRADSIKTGKIHLQFLTKL